MESNGPNLDVKRINKWKIHRTLGKGGFAKVKLGEDIETGVRVAIKILNLKSAED